MKKPSALERRINTLKEFYTHKELCQYFDMVFDYKMSLTESLKYLETQTLIEYQVFQKKTDIQEYINRYVSLKRGIETQD